MRPRTVEFYVKIKQVLAMALAVSACFSAFNAVADETATIAPQSRKEARHANWKLERAVRRQLDMHDIDSAGIFVRARSGAVSLTGTVPDASEIALAGDAAQTAPGVKSLKNALTLRIPGR